VLLDSVMSECGGPVYELCEIVLKHVIMGGIAGVPLKIVIFPPADIMLPPYISKSLEAPNNSPPE